MGGVRVLGNNTQLGGVCGWAPARCTVLVLQATRVLGSVPASVELTGRTVFLLRRVQGAGQCELGWGVEQNGSSLQRILGCSFGMTEA